MGIILILRMETNRQSSGDPDVVDGHSLLLNKRSQIREGHLNAT